MPRFHLQQEGCLTMMQGSLCEAHSSKPHPTPSTPAQWCQTRETKDGPQTEKQSLRLQKTRRGIGWQDFWKGNVQGCTEGEPGAGKHRRNGRQNCSVSALQPGHLSSHLLKRSSAETLLNWAFHKGGEGIPIKRMSIALPVSAGQGSAWNNAGHCFWLLCKIWPWLDVGRVR